VATIPTQITVLTAKQKKMIDKIRAVTPPAFLAAVPPGIGQEIRLLGLIGWAINDINNMGPRQNLTFETFPDNQMDGLLVMSVSVVILMLEQMRYSLADVSYSENGYSINVDRVGKIGQAFANFKTMYDNILYGYKMGILLDNSGTGLATPRFQSNLSRFITILGNGAFGWNIP
jgi:hypothetical protein